MTLPKETPPADAPMDERHRERAEFNRIARFMELEAMDDDCEDQACTEMPTHCLQWQCRYNFGRGNKAIKLVNRGGFMCCPQCGGSYGASVSASCSRPEET